MPAPRLIWRSLQARRALRGRGVSTEDILPMTAADRQCGVLDVRLNGKARPAITTTRRSRGCVSFTYAEDWFV